MGVSGLLARSAARRAHVLLVEVPGQWHLRATVESTALARGWRVAESPADADILMVCGTPGPRLTEAIELVWQQLPGPRVRVELSAAAAIEARLEEAYDALLDTGQHRHDARDRPTAADLLESRTGLAPASSDHGGMDHEGMDHEGMDHEGMDHEGMDHEGMDHEGMDHEGMDHGDMEMSPGGIPLAEGGEDRDGLEMDLLNLPLGPVLRHWPGGLVVHCALQGDLVTAASVEVLDGQTQHGEPAHGRAGTLDNAASLLALAGWDSAASEARALRDAMLLGVEEAEVTTRLNRLYGRVRRSRVLRWSLRGLRPLAEAELEQKGLPARFGGDTYTRLLDMLNRAGADHARPDSFAVDHLRALVAGLDLATARLVVASLDLHELQPGHAHEAATHA